MERERAAASEASATSCGGREQRALEEKRKAESSFRDVRRQLEEAEARADAERAAATDARAGEQRASLELTQLRVKNEELGIATATTPQCCPVLASLPPCTPPSNRGRIACLLTLLLVCPPSCFLIPLVRSCGCR